MYDALDVARHVLTVCEDIGDMTNLRLQKLLYALQIESCRTRGELLFSNRIEAWHYGAVVPDVYYEYWLNVADPIRYFRPLRMDGFPISDGRVRDLATLPVDVLIEMSQDGIWK